MTTKILVTGGDGFLGRQVVSLLKSDEKVHEVWAPSRQDLDVADLGAVREAWQRFGPTHLIHLAAYARGLGGNLEARERSFFANEAVVRAPLLAALEFGVQHVFFAGTVAEYGFPYRGLPLVETDVDEGLPHDGELFYALSKRGAENYLQAIRQRWGAGFVRGLISNMYGPGDRLDASAGHVVAAMCLRIRDATANRHSSVTFWGVPETTRDFIYVGDVATGIVRTLDRHVGTVNMASGLTYDMATVARVITKEYGFSGAALWDADKPVGIPHRSVDNSLLLRVTGMSFMSLADGIAKTLVCDPRLEVSPR